MSDTYQRLVEAFPDRVGRSGFWAPIDGYQIDVVDLGIHCKWSLFAQRDKPMFLCSGTDLAAVKCWHDACDALDEHRNAVT